MTIHRKMQVKKYFTTWQMWNDCTL